MIELVLAVFLLCVVVMATMAVKIGFSVIDFTRATNKLLEEIKNRQDEIAGLLREGRGKNADREV